MNRGSCLARNRHIRGSVATRFNASSGWRTLPIKKNRATPARMAASRCTARRRISLFRDSATQPRDPTSVSHSSAASGQDERRADYMPHGAIPWRADLDKQGFDELTPISSQARSAFERYLRVNPRLGAGPVFRNIKRVEAPISKIAADHLLRTAEKKADLPKLERGLWHAYRRLWASERKRLPDVDTSKAGGWRDIATMRRSYQQPDPATTLRVIENSPAESESSRLAQSPKEATSRA